MNLEYEIEEFKFINGYINYSISNHGRVRNNCTGRILKPDTIKNGYYRVGLCTKGKVSRYLVHRLVAIAFVDNPENKACVDHIDNNKKK